MGPETYYDECQRDEMADLFGPRCIYCESETDENGRCVDGCDDDEDEEEEFGE